MTSLTATPDPLDPGDVLTICVYGVPDAEVGPVLIKLTVTDTAGDEAEIELYAEIDADRNACLPWNSEDDFAGCTIQSLGNTVVVAPS